MNPQKPVCSGLPSILYMQMNYMSLDYLQPSLCTSSKNQTPYSGNGCTPEVRKHPSNLLYQCCPLALMVLVVLGVLPALEDLCLPLRQVLPISPSNLERQNIQKIRKLQHFFDVFHHLRTGESHEMRSKSKATSERRSNEGPLFHTPVRI